MAPADSPFDRPHGGNGKFVASFTTAQRDAEAARLRSNGHTYQDIADRLGWNNKGDAHHAVKRVLDATVREAGDELRALELSRLDAMYVAAMGVLERQHVTVSNGKVISLPDPDTGEIAPLVDDAPTLAAIDRLLKIQERRARLLGLDAPVKRDLTINAERAAAIEALAEELAE